jgi:hypothetical protein
LSKGTGFLVFDGNAAFSKLAAFSRLAIIDEAAAFSLEPDMLSN